MKKIISVLVMSLALFSIQLRAEKNQLSLSTEI